MTSMEEGNLRRVRRGMDPMELVGQLVCPVCRTGLVARGASFECSGSSCGISFPVIGGVPVLINERNSVFAIDDFRASQWVSLDEIEGARNSLRLKLQKLFPTMSRNIAARKNYQLFASLVRSKCDASTPRVLVIGAGPEAGEGFEELESIPSLQLVETDVAFGPTTGVICDAHDLPFRENSFDGVIIQAVLEHVVDPARCVAEIHRVLRPEGLVYAETPFMQQVHMGAYDFTRFTHLGHRRLFRQFTEVESGIACGPGMALAWSYQYFMVSLARGNATRRALKAFARVTGFFLKYFDQWAIRNPAAYDAASGFYFIGQKSDETLSDRDLIKQYRGAIWASGTG